MALGSLKHHLKSVNHPDGPPGASKVMTHTHTKMPEKRVYPAASLCLSVFVCVCISTNVHFAATGNVENVHFHFNAIL